MNELNIISCTLSKKCEGKKEKRKVKEGSEFWCQRIEVRVLTKWISRLILCPLSFIPLSLDRMRTIRLRWQAWKNKWPEERHKKEISSKWERQFREREDSDRSTRIQAVHSLTRGWLQTSKSSLTMMSSSIQERRESYCWIEGCVGQSKGIFFVPSFCQKWFI